MTVVDDPIKPHGSRLAGAGGIDRVGTLVLFVVTEIGVTDFMRHQECLFKGRPTVLVNNESSVAIEERATAIQRVRTRCAFLHCQLPGLRFGNSEGIRRPRVASQTNGSAVQLGSSLPGELDRVHLLAPINQSLHSRGLHASVTQDFLK